MAVLLTILIVRCWYVCGVCDGMWVKERAVRCSAKREKKAK